MKLLKFKAKNIFSLGEVEVNLNDRGLILVTGHSLDEGSSNGSGKSSIANKGILWTLYGSTAGGLRADDVLNRHGDLKSGWGSIDFIGHDGHNYTVKRSRPRGLDFYKDGTLVAARKASETQEQIDKALGLDFQTFIQTYMFGQGRLNSYASLPPAEQKAILEQILPMEQLGTWVEYAKTCLVDLKNAENLLNSKLAMLEMEGITHIKNIDMVREKSTQWLETKEAKLDEALSALTLHRNVLAERDDRLEMLKEKLAKQPDFAKEYKRLDSALETLNEEVNDLLAKMHLVNERKHQWTRAHEAHLQKHMKIDDGTCPTCSRAITDDETVAKIQAENLTNSEKALEASLNVVQCTSMYLQIQEERQAKITEAQRAFASKMELDAIQKEDNFLRVQISELTGLQNEEEKYIKRAELIASERNPFEDLLQSYDNSLAAVLEKQVPFTAKRKATAEEIQHVEHWLKVFGHDIRIKLFETVCNFLDEQTNGYLKQLKNPQLRVQFSTLKRLASGEVKEDFNVRVYSEKGGEGFDTLSGGEQQIVSFAIGKALGDLSKSQTKGSSDFQILDEPFSMLDPRNCEALVEFLGKEKGTIMLISNDENLMNLVPERLHVEKYKGVTRVAYGG